MHNSLFIREALRTANRAPVYTRFRDPYRALTLRPDALPAESEFSLTGGAWCLDDSGVPLEVAAALREDLGALFARLGLKLDRGGRRRLRLTFEADLGERDARLCLAPDDICLSGGGAAGLWAALTWFVWELRIRRAPLLPRARREYRAAWAVQVSQGPWGGNYSVPDFSPEFLSDDSLRLYAHGGVNSMMVYGDLLCYVRSSVLPELDHPDADRHLEVLREAAARAARYGVGFTYVPVHPKLAPDHPVFLAHPDVRGRSFQIEGRRFDFLCSSAPGTLAFYREQYRRIFQAVPQLQGVIAITYSESFYHCDMWNGAMWQAREHAPCPRCAALSQQERVVPLLETVAAAITSVNPRAFFAEWIYSWWPPECGERGLAAIHATRPAAIGICQAVDKDPLYDGKTVYQKPGYRKALWDYSLDYEGPTGYAREAADFARRDGRFMLAKTETGIGLEAFQFPYVPALHHLARKWEGVRSLGPNGVHQAWLFYGHHLSRAEQLAGWAAYRADQPAESFLADLARADFGRAANAALTCWARFGRAVKHLPCVHLGNYYQSPSFFGPCHPLLPRRADPVPTLFHGSLYYLQENGPSFSCRNLDECRVPLVLADLPDTPAGIQVQPDPGLGWDLVADEYAEAAREGRAGWAALQAAEPLLESDADRTHWTEEVALAELVWRTFLACEHVTRFLCARRERDTGKPGAVAAMRRIAEKERENALSALPLYAAAPWLDPAARLDGIFPSAAAMIQEKVRIIDAFLRET